MGGKLSLYIVLLLFIIPISLASQNYNETGNFNTYYEQGSGFFNAVEMTSSADYDLFTRSVDQPKGVPLVSDLDNDGTNEIIIFDGNGVKFYNNKELDIVDAFSFPDEELSNMLIYNIDGDEFTEIIVALENSQVLHIIEYNGTDTTNKSLTFAYLNHTPNADIQIKCKDTNDCFMTYSNTTTGNAILDSRLYGIFFNSSTFGKQEVIDSGEAVSRWCKPTVPSIAVADYDGDGDDEYIFAFSDTSSNDLQPHLFWVNVSFKGIVVEEHVEIDDSDTSVETTCGLLSLKGMTAPIVFDVDGNAGNGLETVIAYMVDGDEYVLKTYDGCNAEGCGIGQLDDYPESCVGFFNLGNCPKASSLSNVIKANIFSGTEGVDDFCVFGFDNKDSEIDAICGSETSTVDLGLFDSETIELVLTLIPFNITVNPSFHNAIVHSAQHSSAQPTGKNLDEFVCTYGVLSADDTDTATPDLTVIFANPKQNTSIISVDAEKTGREDLIALASTNVWYIDDQFTNEGGQITDYCIDPCVDSTKQINSSSDFLIEVTDRDSLKEGAITDLVSARVILYYGESNQQDTGWSNNASSGTTFTFTDELIYNQTTALSTLRLMGRDTGNPDDEDIIDFDISVANAGVVKGDCETCLAIPLVPEEDECTSDADCPSGFECIDEQCVEVEACDSDSDCPSGYECIDGECEPIIENVINVNLRVIGDMIGIGITTLWIFGMLVMTVFIWFEMAQHNMGGNATLGTIAIANLLALILGIRLEIFSTAFIVIMSVLGVVIIAVFLGKFLMGTHNQAQ